MKYLKTFIKVDKKGTAEEFQDSSRIQNFRVILNKVQQFTCT